MRQPGISQLDMGLFKSFKFNERFAVKFNWEVFNVFNHAMFAYRDRQGSPAAASGNILCYAGRGHWL